MIGDTLKYIRERKGFSARMVAWKNLSPSQLSRVETKEQMLATDAFIKILYRLNVSFEEFFLLSDHDHVKARIETKNDLSNILRKKNPQQMKHAIIKMNHYYDKYADPYFEHASCLLKATQVLSETNYDYNATLEVLKPISDYLSSVETWFEYEISLFTNCVYLYPIEKTIKLGDDALEKIKENYMLLKNEELTRSLLVNLAIYALSDEKYYSHAHNYISKVFSLPQSVNMLYSSILAKIINQVICHKLDNGEYDEVYLVNLLNGLKMMKFDDVYKEFVSFLIKHDIKIDGLQI